MMKFCINFLLSNVFFFLISSQIVYEFNRDFELNEKMTEEEIYLKLSYNDIYTYIKIGKQEKQLKVGLSFKDKALVILGSEIKNREVFDETKSDSYISFSDVFTFDSQIIKANISEDFVKLNTIDKKVKIKFILVEKLGEESLIDNPYEPIYFSGYLGFSINSVYQQDYPDSLPIYLSENYKHDYNSAFAIKFNIKEPGNYKGKIIMNGYPHDYDKKSYNKKQYKTTKIQTLDSFNDWCITIDNVYYGDNSVNENVYIIFRIEIGIIIAPNEFMKYVTDNYFDKYYKGKCEYKKFKLMYDEYKYYVCNKDIDIEKFENLKFELKENSFNLTLNYKNLFYEYNNKYYFLIATGSSGLHNFIIGSVLMKNYDFVFDKFNSIIGFYDFSILVDEENNNFVVYIVIIAVISFLIILLIIYLIWKYFNKPRISRKNELDDEYNYISGNITDDKQ